MSFLSFGNHAVIGGRISTRRLSDAEMNLLNHLTHRELNAAMEAPTEKGPSPCENTSCFFQ